MFAVFASLSVAFEFSAWRRHWISSADPRAVVALAALWHLHPDRIVMPVFWQAADGTDFHSSIPFIQRQCFSRESVDTASRFSSVLRFPTAIFSRQFSATWWRWHKGTSPGWTTHASSHDGQVSFLAIGFVFMGRCAASWLPLFVTVSPSRSPPACHAARPSVGQWKW